MNCTRTVGASSILSKQSAAQALKALNSNLTATSASRPAFIALQSQWLEPKRHFGTTNKRRFSKSGNWLIKEYFPAPDSPSIRTTEAAWPHPMYTREQMDAVKIAHRDAKTWSDKVAMVMVSILRWGLDVSIAMGSTFR